MVLTERDREIVRQVCAYRLMTREQIERLLFPPENEQDHPTKTSKVRKRLKLLYQHRYLERIPIPVKPGAWAWRPAYRLSRRGAELVALERGTSISQLTYWGKRDDRDRRPPQASLPFLDHALKINDVRIAMTQGAARSRVRVEKWLDDTQLKSQEMKDYVTVGNEQGRRAQVAVIPDAYCILNLGDRRAHFFLELDRATMSNQRWKTRVWAYRAYIGSGKYQKRFQTHSLRILTVTTTLQRLENLRRATEIAGGNRIFWFTTFDLVTADRILFGPIWVPACKKEDASRERLLS